MNKPAEKTSREGFISENLVGQPIGESEEQSAGANHAWDRRLSDLFRAREDLSGRMAKLLAELEEDERTEEERREIRKKAVAFLKERMEQLSSTVEPEPGLALHQYIRDMEHWRLEFFQYQSALHRSENGTSSGSLRTSFADMAEMKARTLFRFALIWSLPVLLTLLLCALVVAGAVIFALGA